MLLTALLGRLQRLPFHLFLFLSLQYLCILLRVDGITVNILASGAAVVFITAEAFNDVLPLLAPWSRTYGVQFFHGSLEGDLNHDLSLLPLYSASVLGALLDLMRHLH